MGGCFFGRKGGERAIRKTSIDGAEYSWRSLHKKIYYVGRFPQNG